MGYFIHSGVFPALALASRKKDPTENKRPAWVRFVICVITAADITIGMHRGPYLWCNESALWCNESAKEVAEFKPKCLARLEPVHQTKKPLRVTRFGKPVAEIVSPSPDAGEKAWIGSMKDTMAIVGDIASPVIDEKDIETLRE